MMLGWQLRCPHSPGLCDAHLLLTMHPGPADPHPWPRPCPPRRVLVLRRRQLLGPQREPPLGHYVPEHAVCTIARALSARNSSLASWVASW